MTSFKHLPHIKLPNAAYHINTRVTPGFNLNSIARQVVLDSILHFDEDRYKLFATVVLPDHFHFLIQPVRKDDGEYYEVGSIMKSLKGYTACKVNRLLRRKGTLWSKGYFDRVIRNEMDLTSAWGYILENPVRAGLVDVWGEYPHVWSRIQDRF